MMKGNNNKSEVLLQSLACLRLLGTPRIAKDHKEGINPQYHGCWLFRLVDGEEGNGEHGKDRERPEARD